MAISLNILRTVFFVNTAFHVMWALSAMSQNSVELLLSLLIFTFAVCDIIFDALCSVRIIYSNIHVPKSKY